MEIFKLLGTIAINSSDAKTAIKEATASAESATAKISTAFGKIGTVVGKVGTVVSKTVSTAAKVTVAAVGAASAGVAALTKNAVNNYADYEQLVGGVETLFGDSANIIKNYALEAYQTAGMNANDYMETITGFSASLLQGLGGDTEKAAEYANRAITDMSDNANKMGTDMTSIQNAYQGFAKQNYTMLDNLKLGYGGTKEEMQRLIKEASKMTDVQKELGVTVDESSLSFDNIINAISVVQTNMDITGTTAEEAEKTISGSISSMKASWQNLVGAMANENANLTFFINNFVESVKKVKKNILPVVKTAVAGIGTLISELAPVISEAIPELVTEVIPDLLDAGLSVVEALAEGIVNSIPALVGQAPVLIRRFMNALDDLAWMLWDTGSTIVTELGASILENGQLIVGGAIENLITFLGEKLGISEETLESFRGMLETALESISDIFQSVKDSVATMSDAISETGITWEDVWDGVSTALSVAGELIVSAITLIGDTIGWLVTEATTDGTTINGIWESIKVAVSTAAAVIQGCLDFLIAVINGDWSAAWESAKGLVTDAASGMEDTVNARFGGMAAKAYAKGYQIGTELRENFEQARVWAIEKFEGIKSGIAEKIEAAKEKVRTAIEAIKGFFNFSWSLPKLKLPHISISGKFSLMPPSVPSFSISWYKKAMNNPMIMDSPTPFGINKNGQIMAGGEAGSEVVSGTQTLMDMISAAVASQNAELAKLFASLLNLLESYMPQIISEMGRDIVLNNGVLVGELTPEIDRRLGTMSKHKARGN